MEAFIRELEEEEAKLNKNPIRRYFRSKGFLGHNTWYWITNPWKLITAVPRHLKIETVRFYQRGRRGYSIYDTWSLDYYILSWLPDALEDVAKTSHGHPVNYGYTEDEIRAHGDGWQSIDSDKSQEMWEADLRKLAAELRACSDCSMVGPKEYKQFKKSWKKLGQIFFSLWT